MLVYHFTFFLIQNLVLNFSIVNKEPKFLDLFFLILIKKLYKKIFLIFMVALLYLYCFYNDDCDLLPKTTYKPSGYFWILISSSREKVSCIKEELFGTSNFCHQSKQINYIILFFVYLLG